MNGMVIITVKEEGGEAGEEVRIPYKYLLFVLLSVYHNIDISRIYNTC